MADILNLNGVTQPSMVSVNGVVYPGITSINGILASISYATYNPSDKDANIVLENGDLTAYSNSATAWDGVKATQVLATGKWYWEYLAGVGTERIVGSADAGQALDYPGSGANGYGYRINGAKYNGGSQTGGYGDTWTDTDVIGVALDMINGKIFFSKNDVWQNSGDPVAGTGFAYDGITEPQLPMTGHFHANAYITANFGVTSFAGTVPTGYNAGVYG